MACSGRAGCDFQCDESTVEAGHVKETSKAMEHTLKVADSQRDDR